MSQDGPYRGHRVPPDHATIVKRMRTQRLLARLAPATVVLGLLLCITGNIVTGALVSIVGVVAFGFGTIPLPCPSCHAAIPALSPRSNPELLPKTCPRCGLDLTTGRNNDRRRLTRH